MFIPVLLLYTAPLTERNSFDREPTLSKGFDWGQGKCPLVPSSSQIKHTLLLHYRNLNYTIIVQGYLVLVIV